MTPERLMRPRGERFAQQMQAFREVEKQRLAEVFALGAEGAYTLVCCSFSSQTVVKSARQEGSSRAWGRPDDPL